METSSEARIMDQFSQAQVRSYLDTAVEGLMQYGPRLALAIIVLLVGLWLVNRLGRTLERGFIARSIEPTLGRFLTSFTNIVLKVLLLISVGSMVGIETTSFIAMLGAAGLAVGLALQGSLANFAGGVLILIFRPFKVGDYIEGQGVAGTVASIQIFHTVIKTPDNKVIVVPNGALSNGIITNYSAETTRRVDFVFGIDYDDDIAKAKEVIERLIAADARVHDDPAPVVVVSALADSAVNLTVRVWAESSDYWPVYFDLLERTKLAFDANGLSIPFPQSTVHVRRTDA